MAVKIRLQRHGKKNFAFFHIVVADSRAPRDGRYTLKKSGLTTRTQILQPSFSRLTGRLHGSTSVPSRLW